MLVLVSICGIINSRKAKRARPGEGREDRTMTTFYWDMDGVIANFHKDFIAGAGQALKYDYIFNLEPFTENVNALRNSIAQGNKNYILSKAANEAAKQAKIDWLAKYVPEMELDDIIIIVGNGKKIDFIREDGTLIDDDKKNTRQWEKAGQPVILLNNKGENIAL